MRYFILLFTLTIFNCSGQSKDCSKFKTGTFKYLDQYNIETTIIRNDSIQIETNNQDDIKIITFVEWISDCEYILTYKDIENYNEKESILKKESILGKKINVKIIEINDNTFTVHVKSDVVDSQIEFIKISD